MNKKLVLVYGMEGKKRKQLNKVLNPLGISVQEVLATQYGLTIGELAMGKRQGGSMPVGMSHSAGGVLAAQTMGEMVVFSGVAPDEMDGVLDALKQAEMQIPLKAAVTMYNVSWTGYALYQELTKEHREMQKQPPDSVSSAK